MTKIFLVSASIAGTLLISGCSSDAGTVNKAGLTQDTRGLPPIRFKAIKRGAMTYGAQKGLSWRAQQINNSLKQMGNKLDQTYNFNMLMLRSNVLPPILAKADTNLDASSPLALRAADATYRIIRPAHFVTTAPSWRDYLLLNFKNPEEPNVTFMPKNRSERQVWREFAKKGWNKGIEQADSIFNINLSRLNRDYIGMALYNKLLAQNMVTPPKIVKTKLGITGGGHEIRINDRFARITGHSSLKANSKGWRPVLHDLKHARNENSVIK